MRVGIIVVMHIGRIRPNGRKLIEDYLKSLYKYCKRDFKLYLMDNASTAPYVLEASKRENLEYKFYPNQQKRGLTGPWNDGIKKAVKDGCDVILVTNDDILYNDSINDFIDIIRRRKHNNVSLYGPLSNGIIKGYLCQKAEKKGTGIQEITHTKGCKINGFFFGFTKEFYKKFKYSNGKLLNEHYKWGGQENDLQKRGKPKGMRMFIIKDCWIYHHKFRDWIKAKKEGKNVGK